FWGRTTKLLSTLLSTVVTISSLWFAYDQYRDAQTANKAASVAKENEHAQEKAADDAVRHVMNSLDPNARTMVTTKLKSELSAVDAATLEKNLKVAPTDIGVRRSLLLHRAVLAP